MAQALMPYIVAGCFALSVVAYGKWRDHKNVRFAYAHLFFLLLPVLMFGASLPCSMNLVSGVWALCSLALVKSLIITVPLLLLGALVFFTFAAPELYARRLHAKELSGAPLAKQVAKWSARAGIGQPKVYLIPSDHTLAFSFSNLRSKIFVSTALMSALSRRELDAVILHELGHIRNRSSLCKASSLLIHAVTPLARFSPIYDLSAADEREADRFAASMQKTTRYLVSARKKCKH